MTRQLAMLMVTIALLAAACGSGSTNGRRVPGGSASRGAELISSYGCGACHTIGGIDGADANVGPSLVGFANRIYVAGRLPNNPRNLIRWIRYPQVIYPGTVMPNMGISQRDARDIAAYIYDH